MAAKPDYVKCENCVGFGQQKNNCDACFAYSHFDLKKEISSQYNTVIMSALNEQVGGSHYHPACRVHPCQWHWILRR
jgi:hypothetical protein